MKKALGIVGTAAVVAASVLVASPARADIALTGVTTSTSTVVLNGDAGCGDRVQVTVKLYQPTTGEDQLYGVTADVVAPNGDTADFLVLPYRSRSGDYAFYADWVYMCGFEAPGRYRIHTEVDWWDAALQTSRQATNDSYFHLKRPTSLTYNASPEPAKVGTSLTHSGRLMFDPFGYGAAYGASGIKLTITFKAAGTTAYVAKGSVTTGKGGYYAKKLRTDADGTWRIQYPVNTWRQSQTKYDYVDTK